MCVFCEIIKGNIPADKIYEDDNVLAFLDAKPHNPGHSLIIPKKHFQNLEEIDEKTLTQLSIVLKKVGNMMKEKLGVSAYNVIENNGPLAGQVVSHIHFHIIPRYENDGLRFLKRIKDSKIPEISKEEVLKKLNK